MTVIEMEIAIGTHLLKLKDSCYYQIDSINCQIQERQILRKNI